MRVAPFVFWSTTTREELTAFALLLPFSAPADAQQTATHSCQMTNSANSRCDINIDGAIDCGDATTARARPGQSLP